MSMRTGSTAALIDSDTERLMGVVSLILAIFFPAIGIFVALLVRSRSREAGVSDFYADLAVQVSVFLLALCGMFMAAGFIGAVIIPLIQA